MSIRTWFSSDWHFDHKNITGPTVSRWKDGYRTFDSTHYMNQVLHETINKYVQEDDILYFLGDFAFGGENNIAIHRNLINCKTIHVTYGNHDCFDEETELLTNTGWLKYYEINENTICASYNVVSKKIEYKVIENYTIQDYKGEMYSLKGQSFDLKITPNHRLYYKEISNNKPFDYVFEEIKNISLQRNFKLLCCGEIDNVEYSITDEIIALLAWVITDGSVKYQINKNNVKGYKSIILYQSEGKHLIIEELLKKSNIEYTKKARLRKITHICGKKLKKDPKLMYIYHLKKSILNDIIDDKYIFPHFLKTMSKRQIRIFINNFILGDGAKHKANPNTSWMAYGKKEVLDQLQELCVISSIRSSLSCYRKNQWRLNMLVDSFDDIQVTKPKENVKKEYYEGKIWCVKTCNNTLITRRNGRVTIQGNSNLKKHPECFTSIQEELRIELEGYKLWMRHYPEPTCKGNRTGVYHLYGHTHSNIPFIENSLSMDVGIDHAYKLTGEYRPFELSEVIKIINSNYSK